MERVLVLCDDYWHPAEVVQKGLSLLEGGRYTFDVVTDCKDILTPALIARYRVILCDKCDQINCGNDHNWFDEGVTEVMPSDLRAYVENGGAMIALHSGLAYWHEKQKEYTELVGATFIEHPPRCDVRLHVTDSSHPVGKGVEDFTVRDEHYHIELLAKDARVFLESRSETGGTQVAGYTRELGAGRLCALTPGHILSVWESEGFQKLLLGALDWCLDRA